MKTISHCNTSDRAFYLRGVLVLLAVTIVAGCAAPVVREQNLVPATVVRSPEAKSLFNGGIVVIQKGDVLSKREWAIVKALDNAGWSRKEKSTPAKFKLRLNPISESAPVSGLDMSGSITLNYTLTDSLNKVVFDETIQTSAKAGLSDALVGTDRSVFVVEKYYNLNINELMNRLDKFAIAESKRKSSYIAPSAQQSVKTELLEKLKSYDLFSAVPFYTLYRPVDYGNYNFDDVFYSEKSTIEPKLQNASLQQLKTFQKVYGAHLSTGYVEFVGSLISEKEREAEEIAVRNKKLAKPSPASNPAKKPRMPSKSEVVITKSQPAPNPF